jgi:hypothetical protein
MIGTPITTMNITPTTKKSTRFQLPSDVMAALPAKSAAATAPTTATETKKCRALARSISRATEIASIRLRPTEMAATRNAFGISSAALVIAHSSLV